MKETIPQFHYKAGHVEAGCKSKHLANVVLPFGVQTSVCEWGWREGLWQCGGERELRWWWREGVAVGRELQWGVRQCSVGRGRESVVWKLYADSLHFMLYLVNINAGVVCWL